MTRVMWKARKRELSLGRAAWCAAAALLLPAVAAAQDACFERIDNGVDMTGWEKSSTNPHGPGDGWSVEDGAFVGRQTNGQQGGILMTEQSYADVEVIFEVKVDWGCDSGFFFRTTDGSRAYQVTIDHLIESGVGTIWGEGFSPELREIPYWLTDNGNAAVVAPDQDKTPIFDVAEWSSLWNPTEFNEVRARVEGNPPQIQVWISGTQVMNFTDTLLRSEVAGSGPLAIQVHSGSRWIPDGTVAFRNIRVRDLSMACETPGDETSGGSTATASQTVSGATSTAATGSGGNGGDGTNTGSQMVGAGGGATVSGGGTGQPSEGQMSGNQVSSGLVSGSGTLGVGGSVTSDDAAAHTVATSETVNSGTDGSSNVSSSTQGGCGCRLAAREGRSAAWLLLLLGAAVGFARRRAADNRRSAGT